MSSPIITVSARRSAQRHWQASSGAAVLAATADDSQVLQWLPVIGGGVLMTVAWAMFHRTRRIRSTWHRSPAVVTANVRRSVGGSHDHFPVFTFVTTHGVEMSVQQQSNRPRFAVGDHVEVFHDPTDPYQLRADHWVSMYLGPILLSVAGSILMSLTPLVAA